MRHPLPRTSLLVAAGSALAFARAVLAQNALYLDLTANNASIATDGSGDVIEGGETYLTVTKPTPPNLVSEGGNEYLPWISTNGGYTSNDAFAYQINSSPGAPNYPSSTDKVDTRVVSGDNSFALTFDSPKYLGFALNLPAANFTAPVTTGPAYTGVQIAQWWQGSPYGPPLALDLIGESNGTAQYDLIVHNDTTLGNPSSVPVTIGTGTIALDSWNTFVVMTDMDYGGSGQVKLWQNGNLLMNWTGAVGYNPSTIPYKNPPEGTANPSQNFNVYFGPYRPAQQSEQEELFDDVRWANDYNDAVPVPQGQVVLSSTSALSVPTDGDIGGDLASGLMFSGGTLSVTGSFVSGRAITIGSAGGTVDVASGVTFGFGDLLTWQGGTLDLAGSGTTAISQSSGTVSVATGSTVSIAGGSTLTVGGSVDPFTDSVESANHVAIVNDGSLMLSVASTVAGVDGTGMVQVIDGSHLTTASHIRQGVLNIGSGSTVSVADSTSGPGNTAQTSILTDLDNSGTLDLANNDLIITDSTQYSTVKGAIVAAADGGAWDKPGITSSSARANPGSYGLGYTTAATAGKRW